MRYKTVTINQVSMETDSPSIQQTVKLNRLAAFKVSIVWALSFSISLFLGYSRGRTNFSFADDTYAPKGMALAGWVGLDSFGILVVTLVAFVFVFRSVKSENTRARLRKIFMAIGVIAAVGFGYFGT